jgi:uncharacterized protein (DUF924 family)
MSPNDVLAFWFEELTPKDWFGGGSEVDVKVRARFSTFVEALEASSYPHAWEGDPQSTLALIITLDQFPRNIYRASPKAFLLDGVALAVSQRMVARGDLSAVAKERRNWILMPFMHSEDLAVQEAGLPLFKAHTDDNTHGHAVAHHDLIVRFGRFPHRNAVLGRESTQDEQAFLEAGGYAPG